MSKIFFFAIFLNFIFITISRLEQEATYDLVLEACESRISSVGKNGFFALTTNSTSNVDIGDISGIEEKIFDTSITIEGEDTPINIECNLWLPKEENITIICKLKQDLGEVEKNIKLNEYELKYNNLSIKIFSENYFNLGFFNMNLPFLYSDKQIIDFNEGNKEYDLKFKIGAYYNDVIIVKDEQSDFPNYIKLENDCNVAGKELICKLSKDKFENLIFSSESPLSISTLNNVIGIYQQDLILDVQIKYNVEKENISIEIQDLINGVAFDEDYIAYETNIANLPEIATNFFELSFKQLDEAQEIVHQSCLFRKYKDDKPLLLLCSIQANNGRKFSLYNIEEEIILDNINAKYNFIIKPVNNSEVIQIAQEPGGLIYSIYPDLLDYFKSDSFNVILAGAVYEMKGFTLFPESKDLTCELKGYIFECNIAKSYFEGKKSGYYYIYHTNHLGGKSANYETAPIKVLLPDKDTSYSSYIKVNILLNIFLSVVVLNVVVN